jgi:hypothetical protein
MYFSLIIGILNAMRWVVSAASCFLIAAPPRTGESKVEIRGARQI